MVIKLANVHNYTVSDDRNICRNGNATEHIIINTIDTTSDKESYQLDKKQSDNF